MIVEFDDQVEAAVDEMVYSGVVAVEGTKTIALHLIQSIKEGLGNYDEVSATESYMDVPNHGYLYYLYDANRFNIDSLELKQMVLRIDAMS